MLSFIAIAVSSLAISSPAASAEQKEPVHALVFDTFAGISCIYSEGYAYVSYKGWGVAEDKRTSAAPPRCAGTRDRAKQVSECPTGPCDLKAILDRGVPQSPTNSTVRPDSFPVLAPRSVFALY
jgi:hypothetical protein